MLYAGWKLKLLVNKIWSNYTHVILYSTSLVWKILITDFVFFKLFINFYTLIDARFVLLNPTVRLKTFNKTQVSHSLDLLNQVNNFEIDQIFDVKTDVNTILQNCPKFYHWRVHVVYSKPLVDEQGELVTPVVRTTYKCHRNLCASSFLGNWLRIILNQRAKDN